MLILSFMLQVHCVLVRKSMGLILESVSEQKHLSLVLPVDVMDLVMHEFLDSEFRFQLRC